MDGQGTHKIFVIQTTKKLEVPPVTNFISTEMSIDEDDQIIGCFLNKSGFSMYWFSESLRNAKMETFYHTVYT